MLFKANSFFKEKMEMDAIAPKDIEKDEEKKDEVKEMDLGSDGEQSDEEKLKDKKESDDDLSAKGDGAEKDPSKLSAETKEADMSMGQKDEEGDAELIKKVIADTFGGSEEMSNEEVMEMCKEVYGAFNEMGYPVDKAMSAVGAVMKYAKHLADKGISSDEEKPKEESVEIKAEDEEKKKGPLEMAGEEDKEGEDKVEETDGEEEVKDDEEKVEETDEEVADEDKEKVEEADEDEDDAEKKKDAVVESDKVLKLQAENASLREQIKTTKVKDHLEKVLSESGMPRAATNIFRENMGKPRNAKEIDEKFKLFVETYRAAQGSETIGLPFVISTEKKTNNSKKQGLNFADCID